MGGGGEVALPLAGPSSSSTTFIELGLPSFDRPCESHEVLFFPSLLLIVLLLPAPWCC